MSPVALSNTSGFSNVKNAVPDVPSLDFVSFTSGTDVSTESRTKEIVAPFETSKDFLLLLKLLLCGVTTDCFACFRKVARVVVEDRRPTREDKVDIFFYPVQVTSPLHSFSTVFLHEIHRRIISFHRLSIFLLVD